MTIIAQVRDYMDANPGAKPAVIAEALGLTAKQIQNMRYRLKHGRPSRAKAAIKPLKQVPRRPPAPDLMSVWR